jgi:hypothetical protein
MPNGTSKNMKKITVLFLVLIFALSGCTSKINNQKVDDLSVKKQPDNQEKVEIELVNSRFTESMEEISYESLKIGQKAMVFGELNDGGSVSAERITVGDDNTDFRQMVGSMRGTDDQRGDDNVTDKVNLNEERPNFEQIQNMTEEEKVKFREKRRNQVEEEGVNRQQDMINRGIIRISGEIIDKYDMSLTLKSDEGGSRIIFIDEKTSIIAIKD